MASLLLLLLLLLFSSRAVGGVLEQLVQVDGSGSRNAAALMEKVTRPSSYAGQQEDAQESV